MLTITSWIRAVVKFVIAGLLGSVPLEEDYSAALDTSSQIVSCLVEVYCGDDIMSVSKLGGGSGF